MPIRLSVLMAITVGAAFFIPACRCGFAIGCAPGDVYGYRFRAERGRRK